MTTITATNIPHQYRVIEVTKLDNGEDWHRNFIVFDSKEIANLAGGLEAKGNIIFIGLQEHIINGKNYYSPNFNVWD